jgi:CheY-like chemotaxis protein
MADHRSVLIVEDNPDDLKSLRNVSVAAGWRVATATTVEKALLQLQGASYDLAIVDLNLPDSQGMATLTAIHEVHRGQILVVSGHLDGGVADALSLASVPHVSKRNGWVDEVATELQTFGTKGGMPAVRKAQESLDICDEHWRQSVTGMFVGLQKSIESLRGDVDQMRREVCGSVLKLERQVFGFKDPETGHHIAGCADVCDTDRPPHKKLLSPIGWGTTGAGIGATVMWILVEVAKRIANG